MTIGFTKKLLVLGESVMLLALGAAPASFAGEDGPTENGEQVGMLNSSSGSSNSGSSSHAVKGVHHTAVSTRDGAQAKGAAQTGFGGMAETPGGSVLFILLVGIGGVAAVLGTRGLSPLDRRSHR